MTEKYTENYIEEHLRQAINDTTPYILDDLMAEITEEPAPRRTPKRRWYKALAGCAAAMLIFVGVFAVFNQDGGTFAVVDIDVNPSVELSIDKKGTVISADALNSDGEVLLADMDLKGSDVNVACNALIGSMLKNGYLTDLNNSVLISVSAEDEAKGIELEQELAGNINSYLDSTKVTGAIMGQYVRDDPDLKAFSEENDISLGKAWLIRNLMATNGRHMTEDSLLQLSTQELILLGQERNVASEDLYGKADTSRYIPQEEAIETALAKGGFTREQVSDLEVELDCEDGTIVYEVEFEVNGREYEYYITAETGSLIEEETGIYYDSDDDSDDIDEDEDDDDDDDDD